jgi:threonine synthase
MWRYRELLPLPDSAHRVSLDEQETPLVESDALAREVGLERLLVKDESVLPTGSFKSRGMAVAVSMAIDLGVNGVAIPTAGNAGIALAAYGRAAGLDVRVFMPASAPAECRMAVLDSGARLHLVDGLISDCGRIVAEGARAGAWFDFSTMKEPYRVEGKKTMGLELAEQLGWSLPDVILYPTGGGTGLVGMWKVFGELLELGWLDTDNMPRMVAVQSEGCCPIVRAVRAGKRFCEFFEDARTIASGLQVPGPVGDFLITDAIRESQGTAVAVKENSILPWMELGKDLSGVSFGPESATCLAAARMLVADGWISADDTVVAFNCGGPRDQQVGLVDDLPVLPSDAGFDPAWLDE